MERDYRRGALSAESHERLRVTIADETSAAVAEAARLRANAQQTSDTLGNLDAESETLRRLAELRAAISGRISGAASDVGALRAALAAVFERIDVLPEPDGGEAVSFFVLPRIRPALGPGISVTPMRAPVAFDASEQVDRNRGAAPDEHEQAVQRPDDSSRHGDRG